MPVPCLVYIQEGQFINNKLNGFGREVTIKANGDFCQYIGIWKKGKLHGYGKIHVSNGENLEGLFEDGEFKKLKSEVKSYNPNVHLRS